MIRSNQRTTLFPKPTTFAIYQTNYNFPGANMSLSILLRDCDRGSRIWDPTEVRWNNCRDRGICLGSWQDHKQMPKNESHNLDVALISARSFPASLSLRMWCVAMGVGVFICNYQEARLGNTFFPLFPLFLCCSLLFAACWLLPSASEARRGTKESIEPAAGCNCQALFCGNPANELHLIVNLCVCFLPPGCPTPPNSHSLTLCLVWTPRDLHLWCEYAVAAGTRSCVRIDKIIMSWQHWEEALRETKDNIF